jgi:PAS domain-containing protein
MSRPYVLGEPGDTVPATNFVLMAPLHRSLRDAGVLLALAALLCAGLAAVAIAWQSGQDVAALESHALAEARRTAAAIDAGADASQMILQVPRRGFEAGYLIDANGAAILQSQRPPLAAGALRFDADPVLHTRGEDANFVAARAPVIGGGHVVVLAPTAPLRGIPAIAGGALALWSLVAGFIVAGARRGRTLDPDFEKLAHRLADDAHHRTEERADAVAAHGPAAHALFDLSEHLSAARLAGEEARAVAATLLQMGSHYTVFFRLDGEVIDANPAFLARVGRSVDDLRTVGALEEIVPMDLVTEFALRSLREDTTLAGIKHVMMVDGVIRPVEIALRAVRLRNHTAVLMTLADHARERELERQIDQFTDAVELMVDQRVAQIAERKESVEDALANAGVALFFFDRQGALVKVNRVAEEITGRTQFTMPQFNNAAAHLCADAAERGSFATWFWAANQRPFETTVRSPAGTSRIVWVTGEESRPGVPPRRVLVGVPRPAGAALAAPHPLRQIEALTTSLEEPALSADSRAYLEVIREAVRRLEVAQAPSGDGAAPASPRVES